MKLWIDDVRPAPKGYVWVKTVWQAQWLISHSLYPSKNNTIIDKIEVIDIDHDAGDYAREGGDYIKLLDWLEEWEMETELNYPIHIHSMNPVGIQNMRNIIRKNGWKEI